jgi:hypothetical protein
MIPKPSKRGFGYPLGVEALPFLVRPAARHRFSLPFRDCHGNLVTWNGALGVRIRCTMPDGIETSPVPFEAIEQVPWPTEEECEDGTLWKPLDHVAGQIWRPGVKSPWIEVQGGVIGNTLSSVQVGAGAVVPLPLLQLAARLPRCCVGIDTKPGDPLRMSWNGGEAVIRHVEKQMAPTFAIFAPRVLSP